MNQLNNFLSDVEVLTKIIECREPFSEQKTYSVRGECVCGVAVHSVHSVDEYLLQQQSM